MPDITAEIRFKTARSGGKGGQHVNKVETMVEGYWHVLSSRLFTNEEKQRIAEKLESKINSEGELQMRSSEVRTQLGNKEIVIKKMNEAVARSLIQRKKRKATKPTAAAVASRLSLKKHKSEIKTGRKKISGDE
jgi:ribosome-associated protein